MKPVTEYLDYQQYLRHFYEMKKEQNSYFSYRYMGKRLNMDPGILFKVLQGKVHL